MRPHLAGWIAIARRLLGNLPDAEEVVFQALLKLWLRYQSPTLVDDVGAYGTRVVQNAARDHLRSQRRRDRSDQQASAGAGGDLQAGLDPLREVLSREVRTAIDVAVTELSPEDRQIVELRAYERLTFAEVARRMAVSQGGPRSEEWAKKRFQRAAQKLRQAAMRALGGAHS